MNKPEKIAWIGTGVMGFSMCSRLLKAGHEVRVHSRTSARAEPLKELGAKTANSPAAAARDASFVFTMAGIPADVRSIYFGEDGILSAMKPGAVLADFTTSEPALAVEIENAAREKGGQALDAPVSGGDVGAREGTLSIMCGGSSAALKSALPLLELLGKRIVHQGGAGAGQHAKMCNQIVVAGTMIGMCESLIYGHRAGLDAKTLLESISGGAAACWSLDNLAPRIIRGDFEPGFMIRHFVKDMGIALKAAQDMNLSLPGLALVHQLYIALKAQGHEKSGTQALMLALENLSPANSS